jgi:protein O-GlcNAc transferase
VRCAPIYAEYRNRVSGDVESLDMKRSGVDTQQLLNSGLCAHRAGRMADAESFYRTILSEQPDHPDALNLLGMVAQQCGEHAGAEQLIARAIAVYPTQANFHFNLGLTLMSQGKFEQSIHAYQQAIALRPDWAEAFNNLGTAFQERGQIEPAIASFGRALELQPGSADFHYNLGNALLSAGRFSHAAIKFNDAIALRPEHAAAHNNLANALSGLRRHQEAHSAVQEALRLRPDYPDALNNLGTILFCLHQMEEAIAPLERAIVLRPNYVDAHNNLGNALGGLARFQEAAASYRRALVLEPDRVDILCNLAGALLSDEQFDAALDVASQALRLKPNDPETLQAVAAVHQGRQELDEAIALLTRAIAEVPTSAPIINSLGNAFRVSGRLTEAIECYIRANQVGEEDIVAASNYLYSLQFHPDYDPHRILAEHRRWDDKYAGPLRDSISSHPNDRSPERRLKIGYVSPDFRAHCQALFTEPLLANHDHEKFQIFCYSTGLKPDGVADRLKTYADVWRTAPGVSDAGLAEMIRADEIDILVDLTMHMAFCRPLVFARKPAPVQVTWLAYPGTTGLAAMDYRITDPYLDPPNLHDDRYSERSIRLGDTFWCYDALGMEPDRTANGPQLPQPNELPALRNGFITFGCLNVICKINDSVLKSWGKIMNAVDRSRIRILAPNSDIRQAIRDRMNESGVSPDRVEFVSRQSRRAYLHEFHRIDLCLDTLPYNGHTTSLDSFWMGVPVVTQVGATVVGRAGFSQLSNLKLTELAATTEEEFLQIAVDWCRDLSRLAELRRSLRARMLASPLCDGPRFAKNMESALRAVWREWCLQQTA